MGGRRIFDPADVVVWTSAALLAVLCGLGAGFVIWSVLAGAGAPASLRAAVYGGAVLVAVVPFRRNAQLRLFLALAAVALIASLAFGSLLWAPLFR